MCHPPTHMVNDGCIDQFLRYHLPRSDCLGGALLKPSEPYAALITVLEILRAEGVLVRAPAPTGLIADRLSRYDVHMSNARGLAAGTRRGRLRIVERLLQSPSRTTLIGPDLTPPTPAPPQQTPSESHSRSSASAR